MGVSLVASLAILPVVLAASGCQKSAEKEAREAAKASVAAQEKSARVGVELERGDPHAAARAAQESKAAHESAARAHVDVEEAIDREQSRFRVLLTKEIAWVDRRITELERTMAKAQGAVRTEQEHDVNEARAWRDRLAKDLESIDKAPTIMEWSVLKSRIERDLDEDRPLSMPRSYEKSYGI